MHIRALRNWGWVAIAMLPMSAIAAPLVPLADRVPNSAIAYFGWAGSDAIQPAYDKSHLKAVLDHTNLVEVFRENWPAWRTKLNHGKDDPQYAKAEHALLIASRHPACVFIDAVEVPGQPLPQPRAGLIVDAGDDDVELMRALTDGEPVDNADIQVGSLNHVVWLVGGAAGKFEPLHGGPGTLGGSDRFVASTKHLDFADAPAVSMFVDLSACLDLANRAADQDPQGKKFWPGVRDALGFTPLQSLSASLGFNGPNWAWEAFLSTPSPRTGLLAVVEPRPIDPALLAHVPADADDISATNFDVAGFFDTVKAAISVNPEAADGFGKVMGAANLFVGRNIRRQLLAPLGPQWVAAFSSGDPKKVEIFNLVNDPKTLQDAMTTATYTISNTLNMKLPAKADGSPGAVASQEKRNGITVTSIVLGMASPSWAIHDSIFAATADPDIAAGAFGPPSDAGAKAMASAQKMVDVKEPIGGFSYADLQHSAPAMYNRMKTTAEALLKLKKDFHVEVPELQMPTLEDITPHLSPAASVLWAASDGVGFRSVGPFPGSTLLSGSQGASVAGAGGAGLATSIVLPSLNRARVLANRVKSASNLRQIGTAMLMYATDHQGNYPDTLGGLVAQQADLDTFVSPFSDTHAPNNLDTPAQKSKWIDANADYVYLGKGLTSSSPAEVVLAYEKPDAIDEGGMNVLYGDGRVEYVKSPKADEIRVAHPAP